MGKIKIGSDFEASVYSRKSGSIIDCRIWLMKHGKSNPIKIDGYNITHDMASIEISIPPFDFDPSNKLQFYEEVTKGLDVLRQYVKGRHHDFDILLADSGKLRYKTRMTKSEELNIYKGIDPGRDIISQYIPNGLHIHFSGISDVRGLISKLDKSIGLIYKTISLRSKRRLYGKLGSYKTKRYDIVTDGFEYRTLGSKMLRPTNLRIVSILLNRSLRNI